MGKNHLQCRECKKEYEPTFKYICDECFGPLDVKYEFPKVTKDTFIHLLTEFPEIAIEIMRDLASRLNKTNIQLRAALTN